MSNEDDVNITELAEAVGETPRQIRYLIAEGFIRGPDGSRARPDYGQAHVEAIRRYQELRKEFRPSQIKALLEAECLVRDGGRFALAPGVFLTVDLDLLAPDTSPRDVGALAEAALNHLLKQFRKDTPDAA